MDYDALLKLMADISKAVKPNDDLQELIDYNVEIGEEELDNVAGGIEIPKWKAE